MFQTQQTRACQFGIVKYCRKLSNRGKKKQEEGGGRQGGGRVAGCSVTISAAIHLTGN